MNVPFRYLVFAVLLLCLGAGTAAADSHPPVSERIGNVVELEGEAQVDRNSGARFLSRGDSVYNDDLVKTGPGAKLRISFVDDTTLSLGPNSAFEMREFADAFYNSSFKAHLVRGTARIITGRLASQNPSGFKVSTPEATVGIRGTTIAFKSGKGSSSIYVVDSSRTVLVNNREVEAGFKIIIGAKSETVSPLTDKDLGELNEELGIVSANDSADGNP